jgi:hypothetical protein
MLFLDLFLLERAFQNVSDCEDFQSSLKHVDFDQEAKNPIVFAMAEKVKETQDYV